MSTYSVRLALAGGLRRIADYIAEHGVENLRRDEVHAQSGADDCLGARPHVEYGLSHREVDGPIVVPGLGYEINKGGQHYVPYDRPDFLAELQRLAGTQNRANFFSHENIPSDTACDALSIAPGRAGVQPPEKSTVPA